MKASATSFSVPLAPTHSLVQKYHAWSKAFGVSYKRVIRFPSFGLSRLKFLTRWISSMDSIFTENKLDVLAYDRHQIDNDIKRP